MEVLTAKFKLNAFAKLTNPDSIRDYIEEGLYSEFFTEAREIFLM
jgi:hypothetical protein